MYNCRVFDEKEVGIIVVGGLGLLGCRGGGGLERGCMVLFGLLFWIKGIWFSFF